MNYKDYSIPDFVADDFFQRWVLNPDAEINSFWENWVLQFPEKRKDIEEAREIINILGFQQDPEANAAFIGIWDKIQEEKVFSSKTESTGVKFSIPRPFGQFYQIAAIFIGLLIMSIAIFFFRKKDQSFIHYASKFGEVKNINLPDGSNVILNSNSTLTFKPEWNTNKSREVWLKGEAYFSVLKKQAKGNAKFKVHTNNLIIEVLGTKFNVKDRRQNTQVMLESGKVKLTTYALTGGRKQEVILKPNDFAVFSATQKTVTLKQVNPALYTSWINNKLILNKVSLQEIADLLQDNYGQQVTFEDEALASKKFTGNVPRDNYKLLLDIIRKLYNIEIIQKDNQLFFKNKNG